jgi:hypothetical protein
MILVMGGRAASMRLYPSECHSCLYLKPNAGRHRSAHRCMKGEWGCALRLCNDAVHTQQQAYTGALNSSGNEKRSAACLRHAFYNVLLKQLGTAVQSLHIAVLNSPQ